FVPSVMPQGFTRLESVVRAIPGTSETRLVCVKVVDGRKRPSSRSSTNWRHGRWRVRPRALRPTPRGLLLMAHLLHSNGVRKARGSQRSCPCPQSSDAPLLLLLAEAPTVTGAARK